MLSRAPRFYRVSSFFQGCSSFLGFFVLYGIARETAGSARVLPGSTHGKPGVILSTGALERSRAPGSMLRAPTPDQSSHLSPPAFCFFQGLASFSLVILAFSNPLVFSKVFQRFQRLSRAPEFYRVATFVQCCSNYLCFFTAQGMLERQLGALELRLGALIGGLGSF